MLAAQALREMGPASSQRDAKHNVLRAIDRTAERLGNTRAVCRQYYVHPALIEGYLEGSVLPPLPEPVWQERRPHGPTLRLHEAEVLAFLKSRMGARRTATAKRG
jgi:DNA topoisomerase-1